jgi:hypothetical protein
MRYIQHAMRTKLFTLRPRFWSFRPPGLGSSRLTVSTLSNSPLRSESDIEPEVAASERVIFSGIQPTGTPHLGNFAGAIQQWVRLQDQPYHTKLLYSIVDLHAITVPQVPGVLATQKREILAALLACGLKPDRCSIFYQSSVRLFEPEA